MATDDRDDIDSTGVDFAADSVPDDELPLVVLSPDGEAARVEEYAQLFQGGD